VKAVGSEEEKVKAMMTQSTGEYDPSKYQRVRHRGPSSSYICFRCNKPGHHIRNCPMNGIKRATGIPQIFMVGADSPDVPGAMLTASGQLAVPVIDSKAYAQGKKATDRDFPAGAKVAAAPVLKKVERNAPEEMICPLCRKLMTDAVLIPCCGRSYCDDCIRNYLLENKFICPEPDCKQTDVSPDNLIPNRSLRKAIDNFRNGVVGAKGASALKAAQVEADQKPTDEKPSDQKSSSEKEVIKSEESQSKNEGNRKKSPAAGDASRGMRAFFTVVVLYAVRH
jgi:E3 ubiquitin-protein ligase RBBP6